MFPGDGRIAGALARSPRERRRRDVQIDDLIRGGSTADVVQGGSQDGNLLREVPETVGGFAQRSMDFLVAGVLSSPILTAAVAIWAVACGVFWWASGGPRGVWELHRPLVVAASFLFLRVAWLPLALVGRVIGGTVPRPVTLTAVNDYFRDTRQVREPETAELQQRQNVDPRKVPGTAKLSRGGIWTPVGVRPAVSGAIMAESGGAKGQTHVNYQVQYQMLHSPEHLVLLEVKPNLELSSMVYAHLRPGDRLFEYTMQPKDRRSSAAALVADPRTMPDACWMLANEPDAKDGHWNEKAAEAMEQTVLGLRHLGRRKVTLNVVRDVVVDRELLADLRRRCPALDYVADEPKEWGYIRSTAAKRLKPLSDPLVRRVFAGFGRITQPDFSRTEGRDIVIIRPDWESAERTSRFVTALVHAQVMGAVRGGYAGGPGTKVILDEAGSFMRLTRLGSYLDLARGGRIGLFYVLQSRAQLAAQLGRDEAQRVWSATELKIVGPTSDLELARDVAALSGERRVHYPKPRQHDEFISQTGEDTRHLVRYEEITRQQEGEFVLVYRGEVVKYRVPKKRYHHTQAAEPPAKRPKIRGVAKPETYGVPSMVAPHRNDAGESPGGAAGAEGGAGPDGPRRRHPQPPRRHPSQRTPEASSSYEPEWVVGEASSWGGRGADAPEAAGSHEPAEDPTYPSSSWVAGIGFLEEPVLDPPVEERASPHSSTAGAKNVECRYCGDPTNDADAEACKTCGDCLSAG